MSLIAVVFFLDQTADIFKNQVFAAQILSSL